MNETEDKVIAAVRSWLDREPHAICLWLTSMAQVFGDSCRAAGATEDNLDDEIDGMAQMYGTMPNDLKAWMAIYALAGFMGLPESLAVPYGYRLASEP